MRLSTISLFAFGLFSGALAIPAAVPDPFPIPQSCSVPCSDDGKLCCAATQHCAIWGSQCGEGARGGSPADGGQSVWTSIFVITKSNIEVQTITSVYSTQIDPSMTFFPAPTGTGTATGSGIVRYPTMTPSVSGTNTFIIPITPGPTASQSFGPGGVIGDPSTPQGLTNAQIGGIVGGILGAFFLIALILVCCCMRRGPGGAFFGGHGHDEHSHVVEEHHTSGHSHAGLATAAGAGLGYLFGRKAGGGAGGHHHVVAGGSHGASHSHSGGIGKTGMAALLGGAAAGLTSMFASRRKARMSEKYSTTDISSGYYTSDITDSTSYTSTSSTSESNSSSSSSSSSSSGHPHHHGGRR